MTRPLAYLLVRLTVRALCRRTRGWWLLAAACAAAPGGCTALRRQPHPAEPSTARVVRVVDGDTLVVRAGGRDVTIRLLGIDTPETHRGPVECGGVAASRHLARLAPAGSSVRPVTDPGSGDTRDRYWRLLAYVDTRVGDLGERQLRAGLAYVYRYHGRQFSRLGRYRRAENAARSQRRATWASCGGDFHTRRTDGGH
jgi:micrococcal nuclease